MDITSLTLSAAAKGLRERAFSVSDLVGAHLDAIAQKDGVLHAYLHVFDDAREAARSADIRIATANPLDIEALPPLFGVPIAVKDNILVEGRQATAGSKILEHYTASYDATVIRKLKEQGAIILGKTNMDEFAMGSSTEYSAFGPTKNPHDVTRVPGGSSGGSAAAVAGRMAIAALGSDTGGSIRQPAAFCGVVGMKPTYGAVSRHGLIAMASSLDVIGPLAKTVGDAEIIFDAIRGKDAFDATAYDETEIPVKHSMFDKKLKNLRVGVPKEYFGAGLDADVEKAVRRVLQNMEHAGARIEEVTLPHAHLALPAYYIIVPSEVSANLARLDGQRYGHHAKDADTLYDVYARSRDEGFGTEVKRRIMLGTYALSAGYYDAYYLKAQKVRRLIADDFNRAFERVDILIGPTTPAPAFPLGSRNDNPLEMYLADIYTVAVNLAGLPALSMPAGANATGLPIGLQLIAPRLEDKKLFHIAKQAEAVIGYTAKA
ncbi:MAG: Asp-tRNA(Asn)/Glu-tRNA(Gln) amidotransferase subunit GatA [Patescibacteria group bacterium]